MTYDISRLAALSGRIDSITSLGSYEPAGRLDPSLAMGDIPGATAEAGVSKAFGLGKDDFMKLFLAQLKNQDPTRPVDDKEFLGQLAQFSVIETMEQVKNALAGTKLAQASNLIGQHVEGLDAQGQPLAGTVERLVQQQGELYLLIGGRAMRPDAVNVVTAAGLPPATAPGA